MPKHSPRQQLQEAQQTASHHGMFVVEKGDRFLVYRKAPRPVFLGMRSSESGLKTFVTRCATTK